jgi:hypothetical protein
MTKRKSKAIIMTADGAGGMTPLEDHRFEQGSWPIQFEVPNEQADTWFQYLEAECTKRGLSYGTIQQVDFRENSGGTTVSKPGSGSQILIVWERKRKKDRNLRLRARPAGTPEFPIDEAGDLFTQISNQNKLERKQEFYLRGQLTYEGLACRGELWLSDKLRLGPPSVQDETMLISTRVIIVDALVDGIDLMNATSRFQVVLRELSVFLSVVLEREVSVSRSDRVWVWKAGTDGKLESCDIRNTGYIEQEARSEMPRKGEIPALPTKLVKRPDFSLRGFTGQNTELQIPADITELWDTFNGLSEEKRRKFLQTGSMWQLACSLRSDHETAKFVFTVSACETLKPPEPRYRDHNVYHVIEALLGKPSADMLQKEWFRPQDVRNAYLHSGEFRGSEFVPYMMAPRFEYPWFDHARRAMAVLAPAAIIEWLTRGGNFSMVPLKRRTSWRRTVKEKAPLLIPIALIAGAILGYLLAKI